MYTGHGQPGNAPHIVVCRQGNYAKRNPSNANDLQMKALLSKD